MYRKLGKVENPASVTELVESALRVRSRARTPFHMMRMVTLRVGRRFEVLPLVYAAAFA